MFYHVLNMKCKELVDIKTHTYFIDDEDNNNIVITR